MGQTNQKNDAWENITISNRFMFSFRNKGFSFLQKLLHFIRFFLSFFLGGEKCLRCGGKSYVIPLCRKCLLDFSKPDFSNRCKNCGKPLVSEIELCSSCRNSPVIKTLDGVFPLHSYRFWKKNLLFEWKLSEKRALSVYFAEFLSRKLFELEKTFGELTVVPVPPRPGKIREKGWDQMEELAFYLKKGWGFKILPVLRRLSKIQQKKLCRIQRIETIGNAYSLLTEKKLRRMKAKIPETAVILDDVITTGSTVENCAEILKAWGVKKIIGLSIFVVD